MAYSEDEPPAGAPEWMVTYSDMISLLVTFFILLMTFSTSASSDSFPLFGSMQGPGGVVDRGGQTAPPPPEDDVMAAMDVRRGGTVPHVRPAIRLPESLDEMGQRLTEEQVEIDLTRTPDGILIRLDERCAFAPGSAEVGTPLRRALGEIARVFENYAFGMVVEGHTDTEFEPTPEHPTADSLAVERARSAARAMLDASALSPHLVQLAGHGARRPRGPNSTALERTRNRRVEVRVVSLSREQDLARRRGTEGPR